MVPKAVLLRVSACAGAAPFGDIPLDSDDGFDASLGSRVEEIDGAMHVAVVGERDRGLAQGLGPVYQIIDLAQAIEQGVLTVDVEMDEIVGHGGDWGEERVEGGKGWVRQC